MSVSGIIASSAHAAFSRGGLGGTASSDLDNLFARLHLDALSSQATATAATAPTAATPASGGDAVTSIVSGLRGVLDGGISLASTARSAARIAATYASGGGAAAIGAQLVNKLV